MFNGHQQMKVTLKVSNSFSDEGEQWFRDLGEKIRFKYKDQLQNPITKVDNPKIEIDWKFLKEVRTEILTPETVIKESQRIVPEYDAKIELKKLTILMHKRYMECCDLSLKILDLTDQGHIEKAVVEREQCIQAIVVYREVICDVLNYMRYYPEALNLYKSKLEQAINQRDEQTKQILQQIESCN